MDKDFHRKSIINGREALLVTVYEDGYNSENNVIYVLNENGSLSRLVFNDQP